MAADEVYGYTWLLVPDGCAIARAVVPVGTAVTKRSDGQLFATSLIIADIRDALGRDHATASLPFFWTPARAGMRVDDPAGIHFFVTKLHAWRAGCEHTFVDVCTAGQLEVARAMMSFVGDPWPALYQACQAGHCDIVMAIVAARPTLEWAAGRGPGLAMYYACMSGSKRLIQFLIRSGARDWDEGLAGACRSGHRPVCKMMVAHGAKECVTCGRAPGDH